MDGSSLIALAQSVLAGMFAAALAQSAAAKAMKGTEWLQALAAYRLLPDWALPGAAAAIPAAEAATAAVLLGLGVFQIVGFGASAFLMILFAGAIALNLLRGRRHIKCGCSLSDDGETISWKLVMRNVAFAGVALIALAFDARFAHHHAEAGHIMGLFAGALVLVLVRILALVQQPRAARHSHPVSGVR